MTMFRTTWSGVKAFIGATAVAAAFVSCRSGTVVIQVKTPPDLDPSLFKRVAVVPFEDGEEGLKAGKAVRQTLEEKGLFLVEPAETVDAAADRMTTFDPANRSQLIALGKEMGVDLIIAGKVHFYGRTYSPDGYVGNELYTADRQSIPPFEMGSSYTTRNLTVYLKYTLALTVKAFDVRTGRLVRRREFERTTTESYKQSEVSSATPKQDEVFADLLEGAVKDFAYTLETHDVSTERRVARF